MLGPNESPRPPKRSVTRLANAQPSRAADRMKRHPELATPTIGVTKEEIVELFIHVEAYAGAARAFDSYQVAKDVFAETAE